MLAKISLKFVVLNLLLTSLSKSTNGPPPEAQMSKTQKKGKPIRREMDSIRAFWKEGNSKTLPLLYIDQFHSQELLPVLSSTLLLHSRRSIS